MTGDFKARRMEAGERGLSRVREVKNDKWLVINYRCHWSSCVCLLVIMEVRLCPPSSGIGWNKQQMIWAPRFQAGTLRGVQLFTGQG